MKTLMAFVCASVIISGAASASACDVDLLDIDATTFYLYSDPCVDVAEVCWEPEVRPDKWCGGSMPETSIRSTGTRSGTGWSWITV